MTALPALVKAALTGISRELARETGRSTNDSVVRHASWFIAHGGFGLSYPQVAAAAGVTKQAVAEAIAATADRCDDRAFERTVVKVANTFGVSL
jgi:hypothetical protein